MEESLKWANQRIVFGKRLIEQPVIRLKYVPGPIACYSYLFFFETRPRANLEPPFSRLAKMIALVEANQSWLETITYQMCQMPYKEQSKHLGGPTALLKMSSTRAAHEIADEAVQIWGGRALTRTGMGAIIETFNRGNKFDAILGGAEEVLGDLGVRQALRNMPKERL